MIRVRKYNQEPPALKIAYNHPDVCKQMLEDQDDKCYICEQRVPINYQVDHLQSVHNHPLREQDWTNLFVACNYCNGKKSDKYDDILSPVEHNIEDLIEQSYDPANEKVLFASADDSLGIRKTIELLTRLFNGKESKIGRDLREKRFYAEFVRKLNVFLYMVDNYLSGNDNNKEAIEEQLGVKGELLGFKYYIVKNNSKLSHDFGHLLVWNKQ